MTEAEESLRRARHYHQGGKLDEAVALYGRILRKQPENAEALHHIGLAAHQLGKHEEALKFLLKSVECDPKNSVYHTNITEVYRVGGNLSSAVDHGKQALQLNPRNPKAYNNLGIVLKQNGQIREAMGCLQKAVEIDPNYAMAWHNLGLTQYARGAVRAALESFGKARVIEPRSAESHLWMGIASQQLGESEEAIAAFEKCIELKPDHGKAHNCLGMAFRNQSRGKEAIEHFEIALRLDSKNAHTHHLLGATFFERGKLKEAKKCFERALQADEGFYRAHNALGLVEQELGEIDEAETNFKKALEIQPDFDGAFANLRILRRFQEETEESLNRRREATQSDPQNPETHLNLGQTLWKMGRFEEAISALESIPEHKSTEITSRYILALSYRENGNTEKAKANIDRALKLWPEDPYLLAANLNLSQSIGPAEYQVGGKVRKRVAFLMHQRYHFSILRPIFDAVRRNNCCLLAVHIEEVLRFRPHVLVMAESYASVLRPRLPGVHIVWVRNGLISKNSACYSAMTSDYVCVTSESNRDWCIRNGGTPKREFWITGYVQMDPLFRGAPLPIPVSLNPKNKTVLFAPTWNDGLSSAPMFGDRLIELIRGVRNDISVIVKPHPLIHRHHPDWIIIWRGMAEKIADVHFVEHPAADVIPYLQHSDLLISDASSVIFEFLALDRPIVLITNPSRFKTSFFDPNGIEWRWRDVGEEIYDVKLLSKAVERALNQPDLNREKRAEYRRELFGDLCDGRAAERIAQKIDQLKL